LPGGSPRPRYVVDLDPQTNRVIVGDADDLLVDEFEIDRVNWISDVEAAVPSRRRDGHAREDTRPYTKDFDATVKIRYNHPGTSANVTPLQNNRAHIRLHEPQRAVTPGQAAVIYDGDLVLGGGWIRRADTARRNDALSQLAAPVLA